MKIVINEFKGIMPKTANDKLPNEMAQTANALKTATGELVAYRRSTADVALPGASYETFFEYLEGGSNHWVYYDDIVHWVRSPIANDSFERMYTTGSESQYKAFVNDLISGTFDFTTDFYYPGAPSAAALTATYTATGTDYRAYFYTYVSRYGEEGPPSALFETVDADGAGDWDGTSSIVLDDFTAPDSDDEHLNDTVGGNTPAIRIYRTSVDGTGSANFLLVAEVAVTGDTGPGGTAWASYTYTDTDDTGVDGNLGEACTSTFYDRCPDDLSGLRGHPNGFFVAFKGNTLYFSEPFKPWAWPEDYQIPIDQQIIGIGIFESTIVVATDGWTHTFTGPHPESLYKTKLSFNPCLSQRAVAETDTGVMFPTLEGFQLVNSAGINNVTKDFFKPEDWLNFELETMNGTWYNDAYYGFFQSADYEGGLIIDVLNGAITTGLDYHYAGLVALQDGKFRTIFESDPANPTVLNISQWDADPESYRNFQWKSKRYILEKPQNFKVAQVIINEDFYDEVVEIIGEEGDLAAINQASWDDTDWGIDLGGPMNESPMDMMNVNGDTLIPVSALGVQDYVEFRVYVNSVLKFTKQVMDSTMFKLPRGFKDKKWEVELVGMIPVKRVIIATSTEEIV